MDKEKTTEQVEEKKEEPKKAEPKKAPKPKVDEKAFVERKLKAINSMRNEFLAKRQAERLMSRR